MAVSSLRLFSINARGLRSQSKRKSLFCFLKQRKFDILCVQESFVTKHVSDIRKKEWGGEMLSRECTTHSAGQLILFRKGLLCMKQKESWL